MMGHDSQGLLLMWLIQFWRKVGNVLNILNEVAPLFAFGNLTFGRITCQWFRWLLFAEIWVIWLPLAHQWYIKAHSKCALLVAKVDNVLNGVSADIIFCPKSELSNPRGLEKSFGHLTTTSSSHKKSFLITKLMDYEFFTPVWSWHLELRTCHFSGFWPLWRPKS